MMFKIFMILPYSAENLRADATDLGFLILGPSTSTRLIDGFKVLRGEGVGFVPTVV